MSAPETNVETQKKRHRPAIWGMVLGGIFVAIIFFAYLANLAAQGNDPTEESGSAGAAVEAEE
jgi:hypothetical protein